MNELDRALAAAIAECEEHERVMKLIDAYDEQQNNVIPFPTKGESSERVIVE